MIWIQRANKTRQQDRLVDLVRGLIITRRCGDLLRTSISIVEHRGSEIQGTYGVQRPCANFGAKNRHEARPGLTSNCVDWKLREAALQIIQGGWLNGAQYIRRSLWATEVNRLRLVQKGQTPCRAGHYEFYLINDQHLWCKKRVLMIQISKGCVATGMSGRASVIAS